MPDWSLLRFPTYGSGKVGLYQKTAALVDFLPLHFPFGGRTNLTLKRLPWAAWRLRRRGSWRQVKPNYRF